MRSAKTNTQVPVKGFGTRIVKWILEYSDLMTQ